MEHFKRHRFIWNLLRPFFRLFLRLKFNYRPRVSPLEAPCLVVSNHCTDWDPFLIGTALKNHLYFIASDHIFRKKLSGSLIHWAQSPITRTKGTTAGDTALTAIRRMRAGHSVCVFAEGNRSFNGRTGAIIESTAKLAKSAGRIAGAKLVTFRFEGGYLSSPRWAGASCRRGLLTGGVVRVYSPQELKDMTPAQIIDAIRTDIFADAYAEQRKKMIPYRGKRLAEHLERALYLCPRCGAAGMLQSRENDFFCGGCGMRTTLDEFGFFRGGELPFDNVLDWDLWQTAELQKRLDTAADDPVFTDAGIELAQVTEGFTVTSLGAGELRAYRDRFTCCGTDFPYADIAGVGLPGPQGFEFTLRDGRHFTLSGTQVRNLRKYATIYRAVTAPDTVLAV